jgi:hypothetical protein
MEHDDSADDIGCRQLGDTGERPSPAKLGDRKSEASPPAPFPEDWIAVAFTRQCDEMVRTFERALAQARLRSVAQFQRVQEVRRGTVTLSEESHAALGRVVWLASLGWTLPMHMSLQEFRELVLLDDQTEAVERWFTDYYTSDDAAAFVHLKRQLLGSAQLDYWKPLVEQAIWAFEAGYYPLCVPSLLLILEGLIWWHWEVPFDSYKKRKEFFEQKILGAKSNSIDQYAWKSVTAFVENIFANDVRSDQEYRFCRRNLILHGKTEPSKWSQADCLRLLQAISTVLSRIPEAYQRKSVQERQGR